MWSNGCNDCLVFFDLFRNHQIILFFFFNDTATTEIYTLSLHDALPISSGYFFDGSKPGGFRIQPYTESPRSEEHTSELQSQSNLVCRLLLEKKKTPLSLRHPTDSIRINQLR